MGKLREDIITMIPPNPDDFAEYRLLLTGPVGSGKSSFINTVYSVFSDRIRQPAITGTATAGVTKQVNVSVTLRITPALTTKSYLGSQTFWMYQYHIIILVWYSSLHHRRVIVVSIESEHLAVRQKDKRTVTTRFVNLGKIEADILQSSGFTNVSKTKS